VLFVSAQEREILREVQSQQGRPQSDEKKRKESGRQIASVFRVTGQGFSPGLFIFNSEVGLTVVTRPVPVSDFLFAFGSKKSRERLRIPHVVPFKTRLSSVKKIALLAQWIFKNGGGGTGLGQG